MMRLLATDHSRIAFEGSLRGTELFEMDGGAHEEGGQLKRASTAPPLDFVVLPLTKAASAEIEKAIYSKIGFTRYDGSSTFRSSQSERSHSLHTTTSIEVPSLSTPWCRHPHWMIS
jgi:hypothetical protein